MYRASCTTNTQSIRPTHKISFNNQSAKSSAHFHHWLWLHLDASEDAGPPLYELRDEVWGAERGRERTRVSDGAIKSNTASRDRWRFIHAGERSNGSFASSWKRVPPKGKTKKNFHLFIKDKDMFVAHFSLCTVPGWSVGVESGSLATRQKREMSSAATQIITYAVYSRESV